MPSPLPPLSSPADYQAALAEVGQMFDNPPELDTPEADRFMALVDQVEAYEALHFPLK